MTDATFTSDGVFGDDAAKIPTMHKQTDITLKRGTADETDIATETFSDVSGLGPETDPAEYREGEELTPTGFDGTAWPMMTTIGDFDL